MKTLCSLLLLATLVALYTGHVDAQYSGGTAFKGYAVDCTVHTKACKKNRDPVCGMDGITHSNECVMCNKLGLSNTKVCAKRKGECEQEGEKLNCEGYPKTMCTMELRYHCGSDGRSYGNRCDYCNHQAEDSSLTCLAERHCYDEKTPCE